MRLSESRIIDLRDSIQWKEMYDCMEMYIHKEVRTTSLDIVFRENRTGELTGFRIWFSQVRDDMSPSIRGVLCDEIPVMEMPPKLLRYRIMKVIRGYCNEDTEPFRKKSKTHSLCLVNVTDRGEKHTIYDRMC